MKVILRVMEAVCTLFGFLYLAGLTLEGVENFYQEPEPVLERFETAHNKGIWMQKKVGLSL